MDIQQIKYWVGKWMDVVWIYLRPTDVKQTGFASRVATNGQIDVSISYGINNCFFPFNLMILG